MKWLAYGITFLCLSAYDARGFGPPAEKAADLARISTDELIAQLPPVDGEANYDQFKQAWSYNPAVLEMQRRVAKGAALNAQQWKEALTRTGVILWREKWPEDQVIRVGMRDSFWLPLTQVRLKPRDATLHAAKCGVLYDGLICGNGEAERLQQQKRQELGMLPRGKQRITFEVEIERGTSDFPVKRIEQGPPGIVWRGEFTFDVEIVRTLDEALPPVDTPELNRAISESFGVYESFKSSSTNPPALLMFDADTKAHPELAAIAIVGKISLFHDNSVVQETGFCVNRHDESVSDRSIYQNSVRLLAHTSLKFPAEKLSDVAELRHWSVRFTSSNDNVLLSWHAKTRWKGEIEMPLTELGRGNCDGAGASRSVRWLDRGGASEAQDGAQRRDPANHCRECRYDLTGNTTGRCSECGAAFPPAAC